MAPEAAPVPTSGARRVGFFGGSFDPPHVGHVLAVVYLLSVHPLDEVLIAPVFRHPFAKNLTPFDVRMELCREAFGWIPGATLSDVEERLGGDSLTLRTLEALAAERPNDGFRLVIGSDVVADLPKWHRFDRIALLAPPLVLARSGVEGRSGVGDERIGEAVLPRVSSTEVRTAIARGRLEEVRALLPRRVVEVVEARGLYLS